MKTLDRHISKDGRRIVVFKPKKDSALDLTLKLINRMDDKTRLWGYTTLERMIRARDRRRDKKLKDELNHIKVNLDHLMRAEKLRQLKCNPWRASGP